MITTTVLNTSDAEWTASEIMAPDPARIPAASFAKVRKILTKMLILETRMAACDVFSIVLPFSVPLKRQYAPETEQIVAVPWT